MHKTCSPSKIPVLCIYPNHTCYYFFMCISLYVGRFSNWQQCLARGLYDLLLFISKSGGLLKYATRTRLLRVCYYCSRRLDLWFTTLTSEGAYRPVNTETSLVCSHLRHYFCLPADHVVMVLHWGKSDSIKKKLIPFPGQPSLNWVAGKGYGKAKAVSLILITWLSADWLIKI